MRKVRCYRMSQNIEYFVRGYTGSGEVNYIESNIEAIKDVYILKTANEKTAELFLKELIKLIDDETIVEVIKHPDYKQALDGIILRERSMAILTTPFIKYVSSHTHLIDLTKYTMLPVRFIEQNRKLIIDQAMNYISTSLEIYEKIREINKVSMNFEIADEIMNDFIKKEVKAFPALDKEATVYERMFGTNIPERIVECVDNLITPIKYRVYLKGAPGCGKSYFLKQIMNVVVDKGYDVEVYRCSFHSSSIDMIIIREMNYCIFDSSSPHEYDPSKDTDYIVDFLNVLNTNENTENVDKIKELSEEYTEKLNLGITHLSKLEEFEGSIKNSKIEFTRQEVETVLKDYKINL